MTLTKSHITRAVSEGTGFTIKESRQTIEVLLDIIKSTLEAGEQIALRDFGKFSVAERKGRKWRNPATGQMLNLRPKRVVRFKCFKRLKDYLNADIFPMGEKELSTAIIPILYKDNLIQSKQKKILNDHRRWLKSDGKKGKRANLANANLKDANLYAACLSRINLQGADLHSADLSEADLYGADLQDANLDNATLEWASLDGAKLQRASFQGADLRWANLEGTNMQAANLRFANLEGANLKGAKLIEADLYGTNLNNTDMQGSILTKAKVDYETQLNLPKPVFDKYRQTFQVLEWSPAQAAPS